MVLVLERAGVAAAAAAAAQRMRGLPEPVGLGTERQHMFMASFLPPLPSLSLSLSFSITLVVPLSCCHARLSAFFVCVLVSPVGVRDQRAPGGGIPGSLKDGPPRLANAHHRRLLTKTCTHTPLCHFVIWHTIREYAVQQVISCGCAVAHLIFDAFPRVGHQHLGPSLPYINTGCSPSMSEPTSSEY